MKGRNHGKRVYATRPVVARGPGGMLIGADGKPLHARDAVVKDWSDPRVVLLGANGKPAWRSMIRSDPRHLPQAPA